MITKIMGFLGQTLLVLWVIFWCLFGIASVVGEIYWLYLAFSFGNIWMFVFAFLIPVSGPLGLWCLIYGVPLWVYNFFGL